jgi:hypothetical protein
MHHGEASLIANRVIAPDLGDVHLVFSRETAGDINRSRRHVQMKGRSRSTEVRPLRHRLEMIHRFCGFDLYRSHQLVSAVGRGEHEIRKNLNLPDAYRRRLVFSDIGRHVMTAFESDLQQSDDAIVLQLLANRANQYRAHVTSTREKYWQGLSKKNREL